MHGFVRQAGDHPVARLPDDAVLDQHLQPLPDDVIMIVCRSVEERGQLGARGRPAERLGELHARQRDRLQRSGE